MKNTKKSLLVSVLSLLLCVAMLLGTTYAWFTDSVTSGKNTIVAGNLDVELKHSNGNVSNETVKNATNLFVDKNGNAIKWEPGVVSYENFTVENVGDLALKYSLQITPWAYNTVTVDGVKYDLTDVIKVAVIDANNNPPASGTDYTFSGDRDAAKALTYSNFENQYKLVDKALAANASETFAVVLYWEPSENDNIYNINNGKTVDTKHEGKNELFIDLGVNLVATQDTVETDSFNNQYDKDAKNPALADFIHEKATASVTKAELAAMVEMGDTASVALTTTADDPISITASVPASVAQEELNKIIPETEQGEATDTHLDLNLNVETKEKATSSVTFDISMDGTVTTTKGGQKTVTYAKINNLSQYVTVTMDIGKNLLNVSVTHSGNPMEKLETATTEPTNANGGYHYAKSSGILTIKTKSFSPYEVNFTTADGIAVGSIEELKNALDEIKNNSELHNTPVKIVLTPSADKYRDKFNIYQCPAWNGTLGSPNNNMIDSKVEGYESYKTTAKTMVTITATEGTVFGGSFNVYGYGYSQGGDPNFAENQVYTKFEGITFDQSDWNEASNGTLSAKTSGSIWQPVTGTSASSNVSINNCKFIHTGRVQNGNSNTSGGYSYNFKMSNCTFTETDSVIQGYMHGSDAILLDNITAVNTESFFTLTGGGEAPINIRNCSFKGIGHFIRVQSEAKAINADNCIIDIQEPECKNATQKAGRVASVVTYRSFTDKETDKDGKTIYYVSETYLNNCCIKGYKQIVFGEDKTPGSFCNGKVVITDSYSDEAKSVKLTETDFNVFKSPDKIVTFTVN